MSQNKDVPLREVLTLQLFFMRIDILTVLPEMIEGMINCSIVKRAQDKGLAEIHLHNYGITPLINGGGWMIIRSEERPEW